MLVQESESFLINLIFVRKTPVTVKEIFLHRPLGKTIPIPELNRVVDVIENRKLCPLGIVKHLIIVRRIQWQILPADGRRAYRPAF